MEINLKDLVNLEVLFTKIKILHVLTLDGALGEYGGPARVATELSKEFVKQGYEVVIFSGVHKGSNPEPIDGISRVMVETTPFLKNFPVSTNWSWVVPSQLWKSIRSTDLVHIHFARDLIPMVAALVCIIQKRPFVLHTHGMLKFDTRLAIRILNPLIRFIGNRSKFVLTLTQNEKESLEYIFPLVNFRIVPNGIPVFDQNRESNLKLREKKVVFCSRLDKRKRPDWFVLLAKDAQRKNLGWEFEIYGADYGELGAVLSLIKTQDLNNIKYGGILSPEQVLRKLQEVSLLVLPSYEEPYPYVVLESLSVGTPVLIMPSCGISAKFMDEWPAFVVNSDSQEALNQAFYELSMNIFPFSEGEALMNFCNFEFGITAAVNTLKSLYLEAVV
jgi:glycosyltransferase involved in cell wall biosynthesis